MEVKRCSCTSEFQDKKYGAGRRMFTVGSNKKTCTVCGANDNSVKGRK